MKENSIDSLVFDTLIPKPIVQRYLNLLMEHRRIILSGPSGTGKSFLAAKLANYIMSQMGQEVTEHNVASFNVDQNSSKVSAAEVQTSSVNTTKFSQNVLFFLFSGFFLVIQTSENTVNLGCSCLVWLELKVFQSFYTLIRMPINWKRRIGCSVFSYLIPDRSV